MPLVFKCIPPNQRSHRTKTLVVDPRFTLHRSYTMSELRAYRARLMTQPNS
ncbi:MAG: hypothetical protein JWO52_3177 [Gammaproteobacteria bacterium]|nr:hypothetical protein [Gammaproteobacteria bacterium]